MDRMAAIERVTEGLMLLREGSHNVRMACMELKDALQLLDADKFTELLEDRESQVLEFLCAWEGARSPTFQQIADGCELKSRSYAREVCLALENKGYITRSPGRARSIHILKNADGISVQEDD